jgi:hypothetical protein
MPGKCRDRLVRPLETIMIAKPAPTFVAVCREIAHEAIDRMTEPEEILAAVGYDLEALMRAFRDGSFPGIDDPDPDLVRH